MYKFDFDPLTHVGDGLDYIRESNAHHVADWEALDKPEPAEVNKKRMLQQANATTAAACGSGPQRRSGKLSNRAKGTARTLLSVSGSRFSRNAMLKVACALFLLLALGLALTCLAQRSVETDSAAYVSTFEIISTMPHDPNAFTQGLTFAPDGTLYESDGALVVLPCRETRFSIRLAPG